jgi:transcriptional regulator with XRE-family HTH domain
MKNKQTDELKVKTGQSQLEQIGILIRSARKATGLTIVEAAASIGIAKQTLSDLERGRSSAGMQIVLKVLQDFGLGMVIVPKKDVELIQRTLLSTDERGL